jgi:hypothetical protein
MGLKKMGREEIKTLLIIAVVGIASGVGLEATKSNQMLSNLVLLSVVVFFVIISPMSFKTKLAVLFMLLSITASVFVFTQRVQAIEQLNSILTMFLQMFNDTRGY